jgi:predicted RecB family nuclease
MKITEQLFNAFIRCKYKMQLLATGHHGAVSPYETLLRDLDRKFQETQISSLLQSIPPAQIIRRPDSPPDAQSKGPEFVVGLAIENDQFSVDALTLKKLPGERSRGRREYAPLLFIHRKKINRPDKLLLSFYALALESIQASLPAFGWVIHGHDEKPLKVSFRAANGETQILKATRQIVRDIRIQLDGKSPTLTLNDHCNTCEFKERCNQAARERDDLSLLRTLSPAEVETFRERGVFTVQQLSYTFRSKSVTGKRAARAVRHMPALQALAIRENKVYVVREPPVPTSEVRVFFDVEGIPDRDFYYLIGVVVERHGKTSFHSSWADDRRGERTIWHDFLNSLKSVGDFQVFHYGAYDRRFLEDMKKRYGIPSALEALLTKLQSSTVDVLAAMTGNVYFPVYSRGLKATGEIAGAKWSDPLASGIQSIVWRQEWERTGNPAFKDSLLRYNREDCSALRLVTNRLEAIASDSSGDALEIVHAQDLPADRHRKFGPINAAIPAIERIIRCAYFKYQMTKVFFRADKAVQKSLRRRKVRRRKIRFNKIIECRPPWHPCPQCGKGPKYRRDKNIVYRRRVFDLRFTSSGIRRWVVCHCSNRFVCQLCGRGTTSTEYPPCRAKIGHGLASWAIHAHVVLKQSFRDVNAAINEIFGYSFSTEILTTTKPRLAKKYAPVFERLLAKLRESHVLYVDITRVSLHGKPAYVWAFTNLHEVLFLHSLSRDGTVLSQVLQGFKGVLVSDFYGVYESAACEQQKCVIHFIRDLNDDLMRAPQDAGLAELAREFAGVFTPIIETIDRFGLKRRFLSKHKLQAARFLKKVAGTTFQSKVVAGYQRRLAKSGAKLFTFLSHDGVSWNNNVAENAIKVFASRRRVMGSTFTEKGIADYLLFLSIYATLRRKGLSFMKYLQSTEENVKAFPEL